MGKWKSAKRLGEDYGLTSQEMNVLLKEEGFLKGEPGNWSVTEKGKPFVTEKSDGNGYGGYAARGWDWLEWNKKIKSEIQVTPDRRQEIKAKTSELRRSRRAEKEAYSESYYKNLHSNQQQEESETTINDLISGFFKIFK